MNFFSTNEGLFHFVPFLQRTFFPKLPYQTKASDLKPTICSLGGKNSAISTQNSHSAKVVSKSQLQSEYFCLKLAVLLLVFLVSSLSISFAEEQMINIKVAQYPQKIDFVCSQGATWELGGNSGHILSTDTCQLSGVMTTEAKKRYHVIVESVPENEPSKINNSLTLWKSQGWDVHTLNIGDPVYASDGSLIYDGRTVLIGVGTFVDQQLAQDLVDKFAASFTSALIHEEVIYLSQGRITLSLNGSVQAVGESFTLVPQQTVLLKKVEYAAGYPWHGFEDRSYRGKLTIRWGAHNALDCILNAPLEYVLSGIVPSEISSKAEVGAMQAQAVAARGDILSKIGHAHPGEGFDICSEQHCQVFGGETSITGDIAKKILPTYGLIVSNPNGLLVSTFYSSNCGGHSEANQVVWTPPADPALAGTWDTDSPPNLDLSEEEQAGQFIKFPPTCYCSDTTVEGGDKFRWQKSYSAADWKEVESNIGVGRIRKITDLARGFSGRIYQMTVVGENGKKTLLKELNIRKIFGSLKSSCFVSIFTYDDSGFINGGLLKGAGFGHGVGMCQTGAQALAKRGWSFDKILSHYFLNTSLKKWY
ncbi:MAG: SpoIID/LytB domain-containing protein [Candidatus Riflebacteria bacterium]|nr:SpoIID/LytB domain-containing protein [Candidatus Riflebacteria bacterium]